MAQMRISTMSLSISCWVNGAVGGDICCVQDWTGSLRSSVLLWNTGTSTKRTKNIRRAICISFVLPNYESQRDNWRSVVLFGTLLNCNIQTILVCISKELMKYIYVFSWSGFITGKLQFQAFWTLLIIMA